MVTNDPRFGNCNHSKDYSVIPCMHPPVAIDSNIRKKVVVVGGGTGTHMVLQGLKRHRALVDIAVITSMADSGGSTGRLRDDFGYLPLGDIRNAMTALAETGDEHGELLRTLFLHRFTKGEGLFGHNFGNLFLTALTEILGSEAEAIAAASRLLRVAGEVVPVTIDNVQLVARYDDGQVLVGEAAIDEPTEDYADKHIVDVFLTPAATITPRADELLRTADMVVIGPGDVYTSLIPNAVVGGFVEALRSNTGTMVYIGNLMSRPGQTHQMHAKEHISEISRYFGRTPDRVLLNSMALPESLVEKYMQTGEHSISNNCDPADSRIISAPLVAEEEYVAPSGDRLRRSLIRHDANKVAEAIMKLFQ